MKTKLTLRLDESLIRDAKAYSSETGKPLSRIVADLFTLIKNEKIQSRETLPPVAKSLRGILKGRDISEKDYKNYLEEKYL